VFRSFLT